MATDTASTGRDSDKFMLRLPDGMRHLVAEAALRANRSMNAEIIARLKATFDREQIEQLLSLAIADRTRRELFPAGYAATEEGETHVREMNLEFRSKVEEVLEASLPLERLQEGGGKGATPDDLVKELSFVRHMYERQIQALDFGQNLMAECLIVASEALPEELLKNGAFSAAMKMANGIRKKDGSTLVEAFTELFPELRKSGTTRELKELAGKHARGEDIASDLLRHYKEDRANWEAKHAQPDDPAKGSQPDQPAGVRAAPESATRPKRRMNLGRGKAGK